MQSLARIESILSAVKGIRLGQSLTVKQFQRLLGLMAAASIVIPFGLLYTRPLQWWLRTKGVTNDRSEARVDPLTALLVQGQTGKYQAGVSRAT